MYRIFDAILFVLKLLENFTQFLMLATACYAFAFVLYITFVLSKAPFVDAMSTFFAPVIATVSSLNIAISESTEYMIGILLIFVLYAVFLVVQKVLETVIIKTKQMRAGCVAFEDRQLNKSLKREVSALNKDLNYSLVYFELITKKTPGMTVVLEEQYQLFIKFLSSKLFVFPQKYKNGYVFVDVPIEKIDKYFECFFKAIGSAAPLRYLFAVQIIEKKNYNEAYKELDSLVKTALYDHIILTPATKLRYEHNKQCGYEMTVVGNFVYEDEHRNVFEVRERFF